VHSLFKKADALSQTVIGAAIEVHRIKGPGLIESIYERCLMHELSLRNLGAVNQRLETCGWYCPHDPSRRESMTKNLTEANEGNEDGILRSFVRFVFFCNESSDFSP